MCLVLQTFEINLLSLGNQKPIGIGAQDNICLGE